jgi:hypothetical protein
MPPWGAVNVPYPGEEVSGDDWAVRTNGNELTMMVVDGLGHGPAAAEAAAEAVRLFDKYWRSGPAETLEALHKGMRSTRGAAAAIARVDYDHSKVVFAGVGNIAAAILGPTASPKRMMSHNGTVGHTVRRIQAIEYPLDGPASASIVMHSDGISTSWSLDAYPGLMAAHPALVAAVLYRDFSRGRDDATVLVARGQTE